MGRIHFSFLDTFTQRISLGVRAVSGLTQKKRWNSAIRQALAHPGFVEWSKPLGSLFFLLAAMILGYWANHLAQIAADENWQKTHSPKFEVIRWVLSRQNLKQIENDRQLAQIQRELPATLEEEGAFWVTESGDWIYSLARADESVPFFAFCRECAKGPRKWLPMGKGWAGLENTVAWFEKTKGPHSKKRVQKGRGIRRDSREIFF